MWNEPAIMRLTNTVVVALQASMGLAIVIPNKDIKKEVKEHEGKISDDVKPYKDFHGYEKITKVTTHRFYGPKDNKHKHGVKEKDDKDGHHHKSKEHDDDDDEKNNPHDAKQKCDHYSHSHEAKEKDHKYKHSHKAKEEHEDNKDDHHKEKEKEEEEEEEEEDDDDDDYEEYEAKKNKMVLKKPDAKKGTKSDIHEIVLEPPKPYHVLKHEHQHKHRHKHDHEHEDEHHDEHEHEDKEKKEKSNSKYGKMYKFVHRNGEAVKRDVDINIQAPSYKVFPVSDKHHDHGKAKFIKIVHVSSHESHEIKHPEHKHDDEKKHMKPTKDPKPLHQHEEKHHDGHDEHHKDQHQKAHDDNEKKLLQLLKNIYSHHEADKDHHPVHKPHHEHVESKHNDSHDEHHHRSEKKYPELSKDHRKADSYHRHPHHESQHQHDESKHSDNHRDAHQDNIPEMTKEILEMVGKLYPDLAKHKDSLHKPTHQSKPHQSSDHSDKDVTSHHDSHHHDEHHHDKKKHSKSAEDDHHHQYEPKYGYKKPEHAEYKHDDENKHIKLTKDFKSGYKPSYKYKVAEHNDYPHRPHKHTEEPKDDHHSHHESEKKHHSHKEPSYMYKEHAKDKYGDEKKHIKLSDDRSSRYEPSYEHKKLDSDHDGKEEDQHHKHKEPISLYWPYRKPVFSYKEQAKYKHDDEKKHVEQSKDRYSQHRPTYHHKDHDHHHDDKEQEHHEDHRKSKDHFSQDKPNYRYKHNDDRKYGKFEKEHKYHREPTFRKESKHHDDPEEPQFSYYTHPNQLERGTYKGKYDDMLKSGNWNEVGVLHTKRSDKFDPNAPLPRLKTLHILNIEALKPEDRKRIALGLPLDEATRKEFGEFKECSPELITKLNAMYAEIVDDPKYRAFIKYINTERKMIGGTGKDRKRSAPEISPQSLAKIEGMEPNLRRLAAQKLDFPPKLVEEFANCGKLAPGMIEKLNKEYERVHDKPKYAKIIDKLKSETKRSLPKISSPALAKIEAMEPNLRRLAAEELDFPPKLVEEFANCGKLSHGMIQKLNMEYARIYNNPKYAKILQKFNSKAKRSKNQDKDQGQEEPKKLTELQLKKIGKLPRLYRLMAAKRLDFPKDLRKEFAKKKIYNGELLERLNKEWARVQKDPKYKKIVDKITKMGKGKRSVPQLTEQQLERLLQLNKYDRQALAKHLDLDESLAHEFINAYKMTPLLKEKLNKMFAVVYKTTKHYVLLNFLDDKLSKRHEHVDWFNTPKLRLDTIPPHVREELALQLDLEPEDKKEFINWESNTHFSPTLLRKIKFQLKTNTEVIRHRHYLLGFIRWADSLVPKPFKPLDPDSKKLVKKSDEKLKEKLKKTKENGWCNEFVGELENTWKSTEEKTESKSDKEEEKKE
ncbi:hypothetical protein IL306_007380 [Fusarium sp. DS 682]|nr:hypothetical protein IL306_007380 [Fusarium sp. DS 682]